MYLFIAIIRLMGSVMYDMAQSDPIDRRPLYQVSHNIYIYFEQRILSLNF